MRRLLAVVGALLMIVVAVVARGALDDSEEGGGRAGGDDTTTLLCASDLGDACDALSGDGTVVRREAASVTATALLEQNAPATTDIDGWLVPAPWVELVHQERDRLGYAPVLEDTAPVVVRSPVVAVLLEDRAAALERTVCRAGLTWRCIGDVAGRPWTAAGGDERWGGVRVGVPPPDDGGGLVLLGALAAAFFGSTEFGSQDFAARGFDAWLAPVAAESDVADPVTVFVTRRGSFGVVGALEVRARVAAGHRDVTVVVPEPVVTADLVLVAVSTGQLESEEAAEIAGDRRLGEALRAAGWRAPDDGQLPAHDGLPGGGVLAAARSLWEEVAT